jgi:hypothetical protein
MAAHHDGVRPGGGDRLELGSDGDGVLQVQVEHDNVDRELRMAQQADPGGLAGDDVDAHLGGESGRDSLEHEGMVVNDGDTDSAFSSRCAAHAVSPHELATRCSGHNCSH